jgi:hypothetical protein
VKSIPASSSPPVYSCLTTQKQQTQTEVKRVYEFEREREQIITGVLCFASEERKNKGECVSAPTYKKHRIKRRLVV